MTGPPYSLLRSGSHRPVAALARTDVPYPGRHGRGRGEARIAARRGWALRARTSMTSPTSRLTTQSWRSCADCRSSAATVVHDLGVQVRRPRGRDGRRRGDRMGADPRRPSSDVGLHPTDTARTAGSMRSAHCRRGGVADSRERSWSTSSPTPTARGRVPRRCSAPRWGSRSTNRSTSRWSEGTRSGCTRLCPTRVPTIDSNSDRPARGHGS